jgi:hypothetical protein
MTRTRANRIGTALKPAYIALCLIDIGPGFSKHVSAPRGSQNLNVLFFSKQEPCMILFMLLEDWIPKDDAIITSR